MTTILESVLPIFLLIMIGFAAARGRIITADGAAGINRFVFSIATPVMLFRSIARSEPAAEIHWLFFVIYFGAAAICYLLGRTISSYRLQGARGTADVVGFASGYPNIVMVGIPLVIYLYGDAGALPLFLLIGCHSMVIFPLMIWRLEVATGSSAGVRHLWWHTMRSVVRNPILIGLAAGFLVNRLEIPLPAPINRFLDILAPAAIPSALFALGAALGFYQPRRDIRAAIIVSALKLVIMPLAVLMLAMALSVDPIWAGVAVILAATPSAVNVYVFAERYGTGAGLAATSIFISTILSMVTISLLLLVLPMTLAAG